MDRKIDLIVYVKINLADRIYTIGSQCVFIITQHDGNKK